MDKQDLLEKVRRINERKQEDKERIRLELEKQIEEFFRNGGKVEECTRANITNRGMWHEE